MNFSVSLEEMVKSNFMIKILEIEKLFNLYKRFNLSLVSKVTVIKTLSLPKFVYLLTVLPNPGKNIMKRIDQLFTNFLWEGKIRIAGVIFARSFCDLHLNDGLAIMTLNFSLVLW